MFGSFYARGASKMTLNKPSLKELTDIESRGQVLDLKIRNLSIT